jgi:hypothetical protein
LRCRANFWPSTVQPLQFRDISAPVARFRSDQSSHLYHLSRPFLNRMAFATWHQLHWFAGDQRSLSSEALSESSIHIYRRCLMDLTRNFARIISQLDSCAPSDIRKGFRLSIRIYPSRLLHRRNVELLFIVIINLRFTDVSNFNYRQIFYRSLSRC